MGRCTWARRSCTSCARYSLGTAEEKTSGPANHRAPQTCFLAQVLLAIPTSGSARMCSQRWRATTRACTGPRSRSTTGTTSHRTDSIAAILDYRLGRAAEPRDQLSHRVRRGAEQPAPGRLHDAPALRSMCPLRAATTGATRASAPFSSALGMPNLAICVRAPANTINRCNRTINRCNRAGGKTRHAARKPHGRSG